MVTDTIKSDESFTPKNKKNIKIWFSPKSRKVRCCIEKPVDSNKSNEVQEKNAGMSPSFKDLSVFNFTSSSQESGSSSPPRGKVNKKIKKRRISQACKQTRVGQRPKTWTQTMQECKRLKLEAINQQWAFEKEKEGSIDNKNEEDEKVSSGDDNRRYSKKVSFHFPHSQPEESHMAVHQEQNQIPSPQKSIPNNLEVEGIEKQSSAALSSPCYDQQVESVTDIPQESNENTPGPLQPSLARVCKRNREDRDSDDPQRMPKQPRTTSGLKKRSLRERAASTEDCSQSLRTSRQSNEKQNRNPVTQATPDLRKKSSSVRHKRANPAYMKRNRNGETPLHLAAIKGDVEEVRKLLAQGADPNLKDNAGWTPLHEACNLGHLGVVEELLQQGALLNTPGYQNDSPLHDAVRNGQIATVKLLVERGASQSVLNIFGLRPVDYALTPEMQEVLRMAPEAPHHITTTLSPTASLSKAGGCVRETGPVVVIGSQLTQTQQKQLTKAAQLLGGKQVHSFSRAVTHVVVPDAPIMPFSLTTLRGVLNGCWILTFSWVSCSLQAGSWVRESGNEAGDGPLRARVNRGSLLPPLFDGCFFYMLGSFCKPLKHELIQLVKEGGGQLLNRQPKPDSDVTQTLGTAAYHAQPGSDQVLCTQYILYDPQSSYKPQKVRVGKVWSAPTTWFLDCIAAFQLLPVPEH
ncbi:BRCA1-associated RING domain protein 1 [Carassius gibelio]|uniref:BRCA1-associated RING domain protein 1 n=1 Tax=Carassius gibelio TaxID=101364 RepID=UPI002278FAEC|nr:BRCA1-associated RING domain protein 1 [Carassius gibelio]XP_052422419.1 BRCA1-associated RING domain protein 1 [Carassius gibelio]XP_052422420.1 BRCA1-associated RING domain protein 1 [Carassius gibelio]